MEIQGIEAFQKAIPILKKLESAGFEAYFVGGCVRDYILGRPIHDIDITTNASPQEVKGLFRQVLPVGIEHGTVIVRFANQSFEVTTFRKKPAGEKTFQFSKELSEDVLFRDFTINALAMDRSGRIIDLVNGKEALRNKIIEAVESPDARFQEDPLRMFRAIRFVAQLNFSIEKETLQAIQTHRHLLESVAIERLKAEMDKTIIAPYFMKALSYLEKTGLLYVVPIFKEYPKYGSVLQRATAPFSSFSQFVAFLCFLNKEVGIKDWMKAWSSSNKEKKEAKLLFNALHIHEEEGVTPWLVYQLPKALHQPFVTIIDTIEGKTVTIKKVREIYARLPIRSREELQVDGYLLMQWFPNRRRGKWIKEMLEAIEYAVVTDQLPNEKDKIKEWIACHPLATD